MDLVSQNLLMTSGGKKDPVYLDDVFSTYLYRGNGASQTISNGIKLSNNNAGNGVDFDGNGDYLTVGSTSDFNFGTGDYTVEAWLNPVNLTTGVWLSLGTDNPSFKIISSKWEVYNPAVGSSTYSGTPATGQWTHYAIARYSGTTKIFINGTETNSFSDTLNVPTQGCSIGAYPAGTYPWNGKISNLRIVKGTALYTSSFTVPTAELTSVSNTKLLCCNDLSITGSTVTPATINVNGDPTVSFGPFTATDGEGGMVWTKGRASNGHIVTDTVRGAGKGLVPNSNDASSNNLLELSSFNNSGFSIGNNYIINTDAESYASWTWRINKGFFDVVQYTGNGSAGHQVAHSLGCEVGFMMVKRLENAANWSCYHRDAQTSGAYLLTLNSSGGAGAVTDIWNNTAPTSTHFTLGTSANTNGNGETYICYLFAGGASTAATARSVDVDSGDYLSIPDDTGWALGQTWTIEAWVNPDSLGSSYNTVVAQDGNWYFSVLANGTCQMNGGGGSHNSLSGAIQANTWTHMAYVSNSGTGQWYINGIASGSTESKNITDTSGTLYIGNQTGSSWPWDGKISNLRIVKGTAVYTSSFRPPTAPLRNITNTVLLCCNNSSVTGSTVSPGTITNSSTTASTDNPFDDPAGFKFGEEGDQNIIKTGSYVGKGSGSGNDVDVNLGWEPQWIMVKSLGSSDSWIIFDSMRGIVTGGNESYLYANTTSAEYKLADRLELTSTGFKVLSATSWSATNTNGITYSFVAIRRPDGYVGKPVVAGTDVFAMDTWVSDSTPNNQPNMISNFPVDFVLDTNPTYSGSWQGNRHVRGRLIQNLYLQTNSTAAEGTGTWGQFDYSTGWMNRQSLTGYTNWQSWMWKRHAGFDVVCYKGDGVAGRQISHSMNKTIEMLWLKNRSSGSYNWMCYHKGLNGGTSPEDYFLRLNTTDAEASSSTYLNSTAPTSTHITLGSINAINANGNDFIAMLFASVEGVSKVGSYTGNASSSGPTITLGFAPRFIIIKCASVGGTNWFVYDTLRGLTAGNDKRLYLNTTAGQDTADDIDPSATGFQVVSTWDQLNDNNATYIYYAHA